MNGAARPGGSYGTFQLTALVSLRILVGWHFFYEGLAKLGGNTLPHQWHLGKKDIARVFPSMKQDAFVGGIRYYDAGCDDARYTIAVARTAASRCPYQSQPASLFCVIPRHQ